MIFANDGYGIFAVAPQLKVWVRAGLVSLYNPPVERREELLGNAVIEFVRQVSLRSYICERSKVGIVARAKARREDFNDPRKDRTQDWQVFRPVQVQRCQISIGC